MTQRLFRCTGDVQFDDTAPVVGQVADVRLKPFSETCNYIQYQKPLTEKRPCFFAQIRSLCANSTVTLGIAGSDIGDEVHPGNWNGTVGYRNTGRCFSSHRDIGHTDGEKFGVGDIFGVMVTYFGRKWSTVVFLRNGTPVATRYIFTSDHSQFLPTISFENGPVELGLLWPDSVMGIPSYSEKNMLNWIRASTINYNSKENTFFVVNNDEESHIIQCPVPLSKDILHYEVIVKDASIEGIGPAIAIASCSPMYPRPTLEILHDYFKWVPDGKDVKTRVGERVGWGIHYDPALRDTDDFDDKSEQPVLCYVSKNMTIEYARMMMQPEGGWYPAVVLNSNAKKVEVDVKTNRKPLSEEVIELLDNTYNKLMKEAKVIIEKDKVMRELSLPKFRYSPDFKVNICDMYTNIVLPKEKKGIHVFQFSVPLTASDSYFSIDVRKTGDSSVVCAGVAGHEFPLNRYPGRLKNSVGYHSRDGRMYYNDKFTGNMVGRKYSKGDTIGIEIDILRTDLSVILFRKNHTPVGTRYHTHKNKSQLLPTIAVCSNGSEVELDIVFQNRISGAPVFQVNNIEHWCIPEMAQVDLTENMVDIEPGHAEAEAIQAPYTLDRVYNHFEVELLEEVDESIPPPAIALCAASPMDPPPRSNFRQEFLRFWANGEARKAVKPGDLMGWGLLFPEDFTKNKKKSTPEEEQLVICYLSINRDVALARVMYQPPGGFYPVVLLPAGVDRVKLNFGATIIKEHPFTPDAIHELVEEAKGMIAAEKKSLSKGVDPEEWDTDENKAKYLKPVPITASNINKFKEFRDKFSEDELAKFSHRNRDRSGRIENSVEVIVDQNTSRSESRLSRRSSSDDVLIDNSDSIRRQQMVTINSKGNSKHHLQRLQHQGLKGQGIKSKYKSSNNNGSEGWRSSNTIEEFSSSSTGSSGNEDLVSSDCSDESNTSVIGRLPPYKIDNKNVVKKSKMCVIL